MRIALIVSLPLLLVPIGARAQVGAPTVATDRLAHVAPAPAAARRAPVVVGARADSMPVFERELRALSFHAGWGGAIGAGIGLTAAIVRAHTAEPSGFGRVIDGVSYTLAGFTAGVASGAVVYVARRATGWQPGS